MQERGGTGGDKRGGELIIGGLKNRNSWVQPELLVFDPKIKLKSSKEGMHRRPYYDALINTRRQPKRGPRYLQGDCDEQGEKERRPRRIWLS
jgi:hypothetical protein